jgi:adenosylhomocysteine nucleosidase
LPDLLRNTELSASGGLELLVLAVIAAMDIEIDGLRRSMSVDRVDRSGRAIIYWGRYRGRPLLAVVSGVGRQNACRAVRAVADSSPVTSILSIGLAGALRAGLKKGQVVTCVKMVSSVLEYPRSYPGDSHMVDTAQRCQGDECIEGTGVTAPGLAATAAEKAALREATDADIVDMESYWIAMMAREDRIPCLALRAISDGADDGLPVLPSWRPVHTVPYFALHPIQAAKLIGGMRDGSRNVTAIVQKMIEALA